MNKLISTILAAVLLLALPHARAQCTPQWLTGDGVPGVGGTVCGGCQPTINTTILWDSDGAGPLPPRLVIGGNFALAGSVPAHNVAVWDGTSWAPLGVGVPNPTFASGNVTALADYNGILYAAGGNGDGTAFLSRWNGVSWDPVATLFGSSATVTALAVYNGELIVAGQFGGNIYRYNGSTFSVFGQGADSRVNALALHDGRLIAAGAFGTINGVAASHLAAWDGVAWAPVGGGVGFYPYSLLSTPTGLYVGGIFTTVGSGVPANRIARWDGAAWSALGSGIGSLSADTVSTMAAYNGLIIAGGKFASAGGAPAACIAAWNGSQWQPLGSGLSGSSIASCNAFQVFNGELFVGGLFAGIGGSGAQSIARWNGSSFHTLAPGLGISSYSAPNTPTVTALLSANGLLYAGGYFSCYGDSAMSRIGAWDGATWRPLGAGLAGSISSELPGVRALTLFDGQLVACGRFNTADGATVNNIARWNGTAWSPMGSGFTYSFSSAAEIWALATLNGELYAAGAFDRSGSTSLSTVARWDGGAWRPLSTVSSGSAALALAVYNGELVAGGFFTTIGGVAANRVARWDGAAWQPLGAGTNSSVRSLFVLNGFLYAGGDFTTAGGNPANHIARWDGSTWTTLGSGLNDSVYKIAPYGADLIAGGFFTTAGGVSANRIARWNGAAWSALGTGLDGPCYVMESFAGDLFAGGFFFAAGGRVSAGFAHWSPGNIPWIATQPQPAISVPCASQACASAAPALGYTVASSWQVQDAGGWTSLADGPVVLNGATIATASGSQTSRLCLTGSGAAALSVRAVLSNTCGSVASNTAVVTIASCCGSADFNCDGDVGTDQDIDGFFACLSGLCPSLPCTNSADFNADGDVGTDQDIESFFRVLAGGAC